MRSALCFAKVGLMANLEFGMPSWNATTILMVRRADKVVIAGDGQVSVGQTVIKGNARKVRRLAKERSSPGSLVRQPMH